MSGLSIPKIRELSLLPGNTGRAFKATTPTVARTAMYAAAKTSRLTGDWNPVDSNVNDIINASSPAVRRRVRQLVRDFPYLTRAVNLIVDYVVGIGIVFQAKTTNAKGALNKKRNDQIEDAFKFWADDADLSGVQHFYEIMRLAKRQDAEPGEFLIQKLRVKRQGKYLPFCLRVIEPDWLTNNNDFRTFRPQTPGNEIYQGIEYDKLTGERVAYHITDPDGWGKAMRLPASDVVHGFDMLRPNQLRGISPFAGGLLLANDLQSVIDSEIDASKMASKWLAMVTSDNPMGRQMGIVDDSDPDSDKKIEELENAIIEYLRPGEKIEMAANPRPGSNFGPFVRLILTMLSVTTNLPYELLTADYQGLNYSTGKMVRTDFAQQIKVPVMRHIRQFGVPIIRAFMDEAVLYGKLSLPNYFSNPWPYWKSEWQPPGMESIDPGRETKARIDEIRARIRSPQEIIKSRGRDPEDVVNEIAEFRDLCESKGLHMEEVISTAMANNPAAVEQQ